MLLPARSDRCDLEHCAPDAMRRTRYQNRWAAYAIRTDWLYRLCRRRALTTQAENAGQGHDSYQYGASVTTPVIALAMADG